MDTSRSVFIGLCLKQLTWNKARNKAFDLVRQNLKEKREKLALLEHSCFKGESLQFQNEFFSSDYTSLPERQSYIRSMILGSAVNEPASQSFGVFPYHAHYRKDCSMTLELFGEYVQKRITSNAVFLGELMADSTVSFARVAAVSLHQMDSSMQLAMILGAMSDAFSANDYPRMLCLYKSYTNSVH